MRILTQSPLGPAPVAAFVLLDAGVAPASPSEHNQQVKEAEVVEEDITTEEVGGQKGQSLVVAVRSHRKMMAERID
jgi:hypothetical protein